MAVYKVIYRLGEQKWDCYVDEVSNSSVAIMMADYQNPNIPREASVETELISE